MPDEPITISIGVDTTALELAKRSVLDLAKAITDVTAGKLQSSLGQVTTAAKGLSAEALKLKEQFLGVQQQSQSLRNNLAASLDKAGVQQAVKQYEQLREHIYGLQQQLRIMRATSGETGLKEVSAHARNAQEELRQVRARLQEIGAIKRPGAALEDASASAIKATRNLSGLLSVFGGFASVVPEVDKLVRPIQQLGFALALARSAGMSTLAVIGLFGAAQTIGWIVKAIMEFAKVEERLIRIRLAAGTADLAVSTLLRNASVLSQQAAYPLGDTVRVVEELVKAGLSLDEAFGRSGQTLILFARRAEIDAASAVRMLSSVAEQMEISLEEAAKAIVAASEVSSASTEEIARSFTEVGFAAQQMGLGPQEVGAVMSILAAGGLRGAAAGTAFRWMITQAQQVQSGTMTASAERALMGLGLSGEALSFRMGRISLLEFLSALRRTGASVGELQEIFGRYGTRAAAILMRNLDMFDYHTQRIRENADSLAKGDKQLQSTVDAQRQKIVNRWELYLTDLGKGFERFKEDLVMVADTIRRLFGMHTPAEREQMSSQELLRNIRNLNATQFIITLLSASREGRADMLREAMREMGPSHWIWQQISSSLPTTAMLQTEEGRRRAIELLQSFYRGRRFNQQTVERMAEIGDLVIQIQREIAEEREIIARWLGLSTEREFSEFSVGAMARAQMAEAERRRKEAEERLKLAVKGLSDFEAALAQFAYALNEAALQLRRAPRGLGETIGTLAQSGLQGFASWLGGAVSNVVTPWLQAQGITGMIGSGAGAVSVATIMGNVAGALVAGAVMSVGGAIVSAIASFGEKLIRAITPPSRAMTLRGDQIRYNPSAYAALQGRIVRTGQGLATIPLLAETGGGSTFAPTLQIGAINVQGSSDHHKLANRLADTITRYVSQTLEAYYWKTVTRREGLAEVF